MKKLIALILALVLVMTTLGAVSEESDEGLMLGESVQASDEGITIGDEAVEEDGMDIELTDDTILDGDAIVVDGLSLDGVEDNLLSDGLCELESVGEGPANALTGNESDPKDFEINEDGVLVKYVGPGGDVVIPDGVTAIGEEAFYECGSLTSVTIPDSVTNIREEAFSYCSMTSVTIPDSVTSISESAFSYCYNLTSVTIPDSVTSIGENAFLDCHKLKCVTIGAGASIDDLISSSLLSNLFIEAFTVTKNNDVYASDDDILYTYDMSTLVRCPAAKTSVTIPDGVTAIGEEAFYYCDSLTSVTIPEGVTSIGEKAFEFCSMTSVTIPDSVISIGESAFYECDSLASVKIGSGVSTQELISSNLFENSAIETITVTENNNVYASKDGVLYTYDMSVLLCCVRNMRSVTIPDSVSSIGYSAFRYCSSLTNITIPDSVSSIDGYAFSGCSSLTNVLLPDSLTSIGRSAFSGCKGLTSVTIPDSMTSIEEMTFAECTRLKDVFIPSSVKKIGDNALHYEKFYDPDGDWKYFPLRLTIHGYKGSYAETYARIEGFEFLPIGSSVSLSNAKLTVANQVYSGKAKKPEVKVVLDGRTLIKSTDYTVSYKNNKAIGTATVIVEGKGSYTGTVKKTFKINPKAVKSYKVVSVQRGLFANWEKVSGVTGYQLQYGLKKSFSRAKKVNVSKADTVARSIHGLKKGKTYYVRIRTYKKVGKKTYYSNWSAAKKVKIR